MTPETRILKQLQVAAFVDGEAKVTLNGEEIASIARDRGFYWTTVLGCPYGGGKTITNATKAAAIGYYLLTRPGKEMTR